ncbi:MFS transporter [Nonomuraea sp. NN258]|uniref:MFS transporter n=1 Tax=Nonomuraea antri TaxID=2730852 RepID=UPI0015698355|nr:MFS transporter [Nonomuraea antri]NRQ34693.1 MFS transporter [Nonomuraea antri]
MTAPAHWRRNVALFLTGQTVSLFGSMVVQYAVMWWVTLQTRSGLAMALYAVAAFLPQGLVSIFGGVLADRMNRRVLVMIADAAIAAATLVLALLMANGVTDLWIVLLAVAIRSVGAGVQTPAAQAMIPQLVPGEQLMRVNGIFQTIHSAMALLAPAAAGAIFAAFGIVPVFFLDVATAVIGIGLLALVTVPTLERVSEAATGYWQDLTEGMGYIRRQPIVRWLLLVYAVIFLLTVAPSFVTPLLIARRFGGEEWMLAVLEIAFSLGMMLGGVLMSTVLAKRGRVGLILFAVYGFGVATVALGLSPNIWVFYLFMFAFGLLVPPFSTPFMTLIQETVEPSMHGRVFSYVGIVMALATPVGMVVFGPLADVVSVPALLIAAGVMAVGVMAIATRLPSGRAALAAARQPSVGEQPSAGVEGSADADADAEASGEPDAEASGRPTGTAP